ncbi:hypothetical protein [Streptomyces sp. 3211]|uniref:hypothetical protein n=1 Tax=Streptomyces sp. 3211 TaxID=1964449 RepID=UPI0009A500DE|nr:hypothetical protein [Streptomyces sp. 3211]
MASPQITEAECRRCGTLIAGLDGRYACGVCGWSNHWSEGHTDLPTAADDVDLPIAPAKGRRHLKRPGA